MATFAIENHRIVHNFQVLTLLIHIGRKSSLLFGVFVQFS